MYLELAKENTKYIHVLVYVTFAFVNKNILVTVQLSVNICTQ